MCLKILVLRPLAFRLNLHWPFFCAEKLFIIGAFISGCCWQCINPRRWQCPQMFNWSCGKLSQISKTPAWNYRELVYESKFVPEDPLQFVHNVKRLLLCCCKIFVCRKMNYTAVSNWSIILSHIDYWWCQHRWQLEAVGSRSYCYSGRNRTGNDQKIWKVLGQFGYVTWYIHVYLSFQFLFQFVIDKK